MLFCLVGIALAAASLGVQMVGQRRRFAPRRLYGMIDSGFALLFKSTSSAAALSIAFPRVCIEGEQQAILRLALRRWAVFGVWL